MKSFDSPRPVYHRAAYLVIDSQTVVDNGYVCIKNDTIIETGRWHPHLSGETVVDHGSRVILPGFVNAHTHLELSALQGKVSYQQGFGQWIKDLLTIREALSEDQLTAGAEQGVAELIASGTIAVGDVSTLCLSRNSFFESSLYGVFFREYLGGISDASVTVMGKTGKRSSYAGHAPHTTSPDMLQYLKNKSSSKKAPFSIHLAESDDEITFITTGKGRWAKFLTDRNIRFDDWPIPDSGSVHYCNKLGILDANTLAVHVLKLSSNEMAILAERGVHVCLCPGSNHNLHNTLPDIESMLQHNIPLCFGTDSLASNESLNMLDEIAKVLLWFPKIRPETVFKMATENGANALGLGNLIGTLTRGKKNRFITLDVPGTNKKSVIEDIVTQQLKQNKAK